MADMALADPLIKPFVAEQKLAVVVRVDQVYAVASGSNYRWIWISNNIDTVAGGAVATFSIADVGSGY